MDENTQVHKFTPRAMYPWSLKSVKWFQRYARNKRFGTFGRTDGRTDGQKQIYMPPHLKWWGHKKQKCTDKLQTWIMGSTALERSMLDDLPFNPLVLLYLDNDIIFNIQIKLRHNFWKIINFKLVLKTSWKMEHLLLRSKCSILHDVINDCISPMCQNAPVSRKGLTMFHLLLGKCSLRQLLSIINVYMHSSLHDSLDK